MITKEQYTRLEKYKNAFETATIGNYVRRLYSADLGEIEDLYKEITKEQSPNVRSGCSNCVLKAVKRLAKYFYDYEEKNKMDEKEDKEGKEEKPKPKTNNNKRKKLIKE